MFEKIKQAALRLIGRGAQAPAPMTCPSRSDNHMADAYHPGPDHWCVMPDGTRTCSFCGSLHEDDYLEILEAYAKGEPGFSFDTTSKSYKRYAHRPGVSNASEGGIKFYGWHADRDGPGWDRHTAIHADALERYSRDMQARWGKHVG